MSISNRPMFISFEGIDGCGKSTQINLLQMRLKKDQIRSIIVREPGGTKISELIRQILLNKKNSEMGDRTEALLMTASRSQLSDEIIRPTINSGTWVLADRFVDSTLAYQGGGRNLDLDWLIELNKFATNSLNPHLTFFIDIPPEDGHHRMGESRDRIEKAGLAFQTRVRDTYFQLLERYPGRIVKIDGLKNIDEIHQEIWAEIQSRLNRMGMNEIQ